MRFRYLVQSTTKRYAGNSSENKPPCNIICDVNSHTGNLRFDIAGDGTTAVCSFAMARQRYCGRFFRMFALCFRLFKSSLLSRDFRFLHSFPHRAPVCCVKFYGHVCCNLLTDHLTKACCGFLDVYQVRKWRHLMIHWRNCEVGKTFELTEVS